MRYPYSVRFAYGIRTSPGNDNVYTCPAGYTLVVRSIVIWADVTIGNVAAQCFLSPADSGEELILLAELYGTLGAIPTGRNVNFFGNQILYPGDNIVFSSEDDNYYSYVASGYLLQGVTTPP